MAVRSYPHLLTAFIIVLALVSCTPVITVNPPSHLTSTSTPSAQLLLVEVLQPTAMELTDPQYLRQTAPLLFRVRSATPMSERSLAQATLIRLKDHVSQPLTLQGLDQNGTVANLSAEHWRKAFQFDTTYALYIPELTTRDRRISATHPWTFHTEEEPYSFTVGEPKLLSLSPPTIEIIVQNTSRMMVPAGAVQFTAVCDQDIKDRDHTVYFASSKSESFRQGEVRPVRLTVDREFAFQPAWRDDFPSGGCRGEAVVRLGKRLVSQHR